MLTNPSPAARRMSAAAPERPDDLSDHRHRQVIGYLGLALPFLLLLAEYFRPNASSDGWTRASISIYYWSGAVAIFVAIVAALSIYLLTYRGYANDAYRYDRGAALIAGVSAAVVVLFPTAPPPGLASPSPGSAPWWHAWVGVTHHLAASLLFAMFAVFSLWLFRKSAPGETPAPDKKRRNMIYLVAGIGIVICMAWAVVAGLQDHSIFLPESGALICFAISWLTKGRAVHSIKATLRAATHPHPTTPMPTRTTTLLSLAALSVVAAPLVAQQTDLAPYMIADRAAEVALARSAAPRPISDSATVLVLTRTGFVEAAHGANGFTCAVFRSFLGGVTDPGYWSPKVRAPICFNPPASRTVLREGVVRAGWVMSGVEQKEIAARTDRAYASHDFPLPAPGAMVYMLSPQQYLSDDDPHWMPHLMFFYDRSLPAAAFGAGGFTAPIIDGSVGTPSAPVLTLLIPVRQWSDGTPAVATSGH